MSDHVLFDLSNELKKGDRLHIEFDKFNITRARMLESIYHMTLRLL